MTNLKSVNIGHNKYCAPAVLSILTGKSTDECAAVISKINGKYKITGVMIHDLLLAAKQMGFDTEIIFGSNNISLYRLLVSIASRDGIYITMVTGHFVVIEVKDKKIYFCDNHTKEPIPAASSSRLQMQVLACYRVVKNENFVEPVKPIETKIEKQITASSSLEFTLVGKDGDVIIHKRIGFPYLVDALRIDKEIAEMLLRIADEREI